MRVDSGLAGMIIAVGFMVMGIVGVPIAKWFLIAGIMLGIGIAVVLRWWKRQPPEDPDPLRGLR
jgi:hypothetical protein